MKRVSETADGRLIFWCPGCDCYHGIKVGVDGWKWNGNYETPTISPSILTLGEAKCHAYITDGAIKFLGDCSHARAGQTVSLGDVDDMEYTP